MRAGGDGAAAQGHKKWANAAMVPRSRAGRTRRSTGRGGLSAVTRRLDRHVRVRGGDLELLHYDARLFPFAHPVQAFVVPVQAPDVAVVLAGPGQGVIQADVGPVDGICITLPYLRLH